MIALDTKLLVYAHRQDSPFHAVAARCVQSLAEGRSAWALPWPCVHEFYAIVTHPRIYKPATPAAKALDQVDAWLESPSLVLLAETELHWPTLRDLLQHATVTGPRVHEARIASLCLQHDVPEQWSADHDFARFKALRVVNPLA